MGVFFSRMSVAISADTAHTSPPPPPPDAHPRYIRHPGLSNIMSVDWNPRWIVSPLIASFHAGVAVLMSPDIPLQLGLDSRQQFCLQSLPSMERLPLQYTVCVAHNVKAAHQEAVQQLSQHSRELPNMRTLWSVILRFRLVEMRTVCCQSSNMLYHQVKGWCEWGTICTCCISVGILGIVTLNPHFFPRAAAASV